MAAEDWCNVSFFGLRSPKPATCMTYQYVAAIKLGVYWGLNTGMDAFSTGNPSLHAVKNHHRCLVRLGALVSVTNMQLDEGHGTFMHTSHRLFIPLDHTASCWRNLFSRA